MRCKPILALSIALVALLIALSVSNTTTLAQSGGTYDLTWSTIDGGGESAGGGYSLTGTIGQPDAAAMSGGSYTLNGGFWSAAAPNYRVFLPLVLKG